ncbi:hypothetical protein LASUN_07510 [Lentilactobacillus sunkii]|jgi:hypothetical protein|uniref:Uncharacterized protein n=1 Tax=Lentilactobacillus sunkii TaxID=481719 RepID=A0A1E7XGM2_9LACO|nr:hypothetical protein [Lentilactobacillus sunkii]OFA12199.1 hypothetical protein LASUN_07510 [Lentilactobacillus sunkii]
MKRQPILTLFLTLLITTGSLALFEAPTLAREKGLHRVSSSYINKIGLKSSYYRLNQNTKFNFYGERVILPKGTILSATKSIDNGSKAKSGEALLSTHIDISYALKKRLGFTKPYKFVPIELSYYPSKYTRVKRPAYVLPYGENILYAGGIETFEKRAANYYDHPNFTGNALKITSDGYLEFYKYRKQPLADGALHWQYVQRPTSYAKIHHTLKKGSKTFLYYQNKLKGVKATHLNKGRYHYRLTIKNRHMPYQYSGKVYAMWASLYTVGGANYFTTPQNAANYGD